MKHPWSYSTTVRNPERLRDFLRVLQEMEGEPFNDKGQIKYQTLLIKNKLYRPTDLTPQQTAYYEDVEKEIEQIKYRNQKVEIDKAWETSKTRRILIFLLTYIIAGIWLVMINDNLPWLKALVPAVGYIFSTLGLLPNGLFDEKFDGLCGIFITIFDVYLKDKRKKFYKNYAELANFWQ